MSRASPIGFGRTTTERRFVAAFGTVVLLMGVAGYLTLSGLEELHETMHRAVATSRSLTGALRVESAAHAAQSRRAHALVAGDAEASRPYQAAMERLAGVVADTRRTPLDPAVDQLVAALQQETDRSYRGRLQPTFVPGDVGAVTSEHAAELARIDEITAALEVETARLEERLDSFDEHASTITHTGFRNALIMLISVALFTVVVGVALGRSVARPIALLHASARRISEGDSDAPIPITGPHEFRALATQFNEMVVATRDNQARLLESERLAHTGRLAAGVAHEINNPLAVIRGYTRLIAERVDDPQVRGDLKVIEDECARCHQIVRGLIDLTRPANQGAQIASIRELVDETVERLTQSDPSRAEPIVVRGDAAVWADERGLRQVLVNLLDNAHQAEPSGLIEVAISCDHDRVAVEVIDHGPGLPAEHRARLFEPFFTTKDHGTGLGLAVSRAIARAQGGDLVARDADGGGACFTLYLPATAPEARA